MTGTPLTASAEFNNSIVNIQRHRTLPKHFVSYLFEIGQKLTSPFISSGAIMATRRQATLCIATSSRNGFLAHFARNQPFRAGFPIRLYLQTTTIRLEQQANTKAKRDPAPKVVRGASKLFKDADAAVADLKSGSIILSAGFGLAGTAGKNTAILVYGTSEC
jgi:hypothetical protein